MPRRMDRKNMMEIEEICDYGNLFNKWDLDQLSVDASAPQCLFSYVNVNINKGKSDWEVLSFGYVMPKSSGPELDELNIFPLKSIFLPII